MNLRRAIPWLLLVAIVSFIAWKLHSSHFDYAGFARSFRSADPRLLLLATAVIYINYVVRAMRWAVFLRPAFKAVALNDPARKPTPWTAMVGTQFIGFTGLSIFGRIGELIRPLLYSRRTGLSFPSQIAVVAVERIFDLGAFGLIFALNLLLAPQLQSLPYLHKAGYTIGGLTVAISVFVALVRLAGPLMASLTERLVGLISRPAGAVAAEKILSFREGLNVIDSLPDFLYATLLSLFLWATIVAAYTITIKAFPSPVHDLTLGHVIVLLGFSIAGSALPIPGGGGAWAGNVFALTSLFHIPGELAASAGLLVWLINSMTVIPAGLIFAKIEGISLGQVARRSEDVEEGVVQA